MLGRRCGGEGGCFSVICKGGERWEGRVEAEEEQVERGREEERRERMIYEGRL